MVELLKETSALREPILKIQSTVEETKVGVEETKHKVEKIFKSIEGQSIRSICIYVSHSDLHRRQ